MKAAVFASCNETLWHLRRVSELETYVAQLVHTINNMRSDQQPTREALKRHMAERQWLEEAMVSHKQSMREALDDREKIIRQRKHIQRESEQVGRGAHKKGTPASI